MKNNPTLVVLAAGLGSRYGSPKQIDQLGSNGETILDYTIFDAIEVGFQKIVFVISENIEKNFKKNFLNKLEGRIDVDYALQELDVLPDGFEVPEGREKPWGTAHAVLSAGLKVSNPFAIVNADDFYGRSSLKSMYDHLVGMDNASLHACLVSFVLENTLSAHGPVSRGICEVDGESGLQGIIERSQIFKNASGGAYYQEKGWNFALTGREIVSMNLMGFSTPVFELIEVMFADFLKSKDSKLKSEFFIPSVLERVRELGVKVPVLTSQEQWFGMTYQEDKPIVKQRLKELIEQGQYPENLWVK